MKTILLVLFLLPLTTLLAEEKPYKGPELKLESETALHEPELQSQQWEEPTKLQFDREVKREIASDPGRNPSSKIKPLFKPWIYKKFEKVIP